MRSNSIPSVIFWIFCDFIIPFGSNFTGQMSDIFMTPKTNIFIRSFKSKLQTFPSFWHDHRKTGKNISTYQFIISIWIFELFWEMFRFRQFPNFSNSNVLENSNFEKTYWVWYELLLDYQNDFEGIWVALELMWGMMLKIESFHAWYLVMLRTVLHRLLLDVQHTMSIHP